MSATQNYDFNEDEQMKYFLVVAGQYDSNQWLQVDLGLPTRVVGVITQGGPVNHNQWVASYKIRYGNSTSSLVSIQNQKSNEDWVS